MIKFHALGSMNVLSKYHDNLCTRFRFFLCCDGGQRLNHPFGIVNIFILNWELVVEISSKRIDRSADIIVLTLCC